MAVPKHKTSKRRGNIRFACTYGATAPTLSECPQCHEQKLAHRVCTCGYYNGKKVVEQKTKKAD